MWPDSHVPFRKFALDPHEAFLSAVEIVLGLVLWLYGHGFAGGLLIGAAIGSYFKCRALALAAVDRLRT